MGAPANGSPTSVTAHVWTTYGGWFADPKRWRRNTVGGFVALGALEQFVQTLYGVAVESVERARAIDGDVQDVVYERFAHRRGIGVGHRARRCAGRGAASPGAWAGRDGDAQMKWSR